MGKNSNLMVVKSNKLINQSYKLSTIEKKLIYYLITKIDNDDEDFKAYSLKISDFLEIVGSENQQSYSITQGLPKITRGLLQKGFSMIDDRGNLLQVSWLSSAYHRRKEGVIELRFDPSLKPFLLQLKEKFTIFNISNVIKMKSSYSMRLYELLKQYEQFKTRIIDIDEFKHLLSLDDSATYRLYGNIKSKILEIAKKELKETSDISFQYDEIKEGRRVVKLRFYISKNEPVRKIYESTAISGEVTEFLNEFKEKYGAELDYNLTEKMFIKYGCDLLRIKFVEYDEYRQGREIKNIAGDFYTFVTKGYKPYKKSSSSKNEVKQLSNFKQREYENIDFNQYYANLK